MSGGEGRAEGEGESEGDSAECRAQGRADLTTLRSETEQKPRVRSLTDLCNPGAPSHLNFSACW